MGFFSFKNGYNGRRETKKKKHRRIMGMKTEIYIKLIFLLIFCLIKTPTINGQLLTNKDYQTSVNMLHEICIEDEDCRREHHQHMKHNMTIFEYLVRGLLSKKTQIEQDWLKQLNNFTVEDTVKYGTNTSNENVLKFLWIYKMTSYRFSHSICDFNHRLKIEWDSMSTTCECIYDKFCGSSSNDVTFSYVLFIMAIIILLLFLISYFIRIAIELRNMEKVEAAVHKHDKVRRLIVTFAKTI